jgi:ubiquitin C-terminal hydrolase
MDNDAPIDILDGTSPTGRTFRDEIINDLKIRDSPRSNPSAPYSPSPAKTLHLKATENSTTTATEATTPEALLSLYREHSVELAAFLKKEGNIFARGTLGVRSEGYVGLANQGATCYLNSLVQALYMLPSFRKRVFNFRHNPDLHGAVEKCIPAQLQHLFAKLRLSSRPYVSTKALTKSFGWGSAEGFQQHDVQELFCTLMDALERSTPNDVSFAKDLFQGKSSDYLKGEGFCRRKDPVAFNNLMVPIQGHSTLESAMRAYFKPDVLDGANQYELEKGKKVDALKGVEINSLPSIFVINLGRFIFDYQTMRRVKINDACSFPETINMDEMLKGYVCNTNNNSVDHSKGKKDAINENKENGMKKNDAATTSTNGSFIQSNSSPLKQLGEYELIATMVHSGTTHGGHYRAFIRGNNKNNDKEFYNFNDSFVSKLSKEEVVTMFGRDTNVDIVTKDVSKEDEKDDKGESENIPDTNDDTIKVEKKKDRAKHVARSCVSSYMLMYKKKEMKAPNNGDDNDDDINCIPEDLKKSILSDNIKVDFMSKVYLARSKIVKLTICSGSNNFQTIYMLKTATLEETTNEAVRVMIEKNERSDKTEYRLRAHEPRSGKPGRTYGGMEKETLMKIGLSNGTVTLLLEARDIDKDEPFQEYDPNDFYVQIDQWQKETLDTLPFPNIPPIQVDGKQQATVQQLVHAVDRALDKYNKIEKNTINKYRLIYLDRKDGIAIHLDPGEHPSNELKLHHNIRSGSCIVLERLNIDPNVIHEYEKAQNIITIKYNLPNKIAKTKNDTIHYDMELICDKRDSLQSIKEKIQPILGIDDINQFRLKCNKNGSGE